MKSEPVITAAGLVKRYATATALDGIDLEIARGEVFGLIGPNGAGKTTLIRSIVGALRPTDGTVTVLGLDPLEHAASDDVEVHRHRRHESRDVLMRDFDAAPLRVDGTHDSGDLVGLARGAAAGRGDWRASGCPH